MFAETEAPAARAKKDPHYPLRLRLTLHSALNTVRVEGIHTIWDRLFLRVAQRLNGTRYPDDWAKSYAQELVEMMHLQGLIEVQGNRYVLTTWGFSKWYETVKESWEERNQEYVASEMRMRLEYLRAFREGRLKGKGWRRAQQILKEERERELRKINSRR